MAMTVGSSTSPVSLRWWPPEGVFWLDDLVSGLPVLSALDFDRCSYDSIGLRPRCMPTKALMLALNDLTTSLNSLRCGKADH
jgi:hypothetical protein